MNFYQIAMDGPAGAGKSTVAKLLAKKLNFTYINSGGMFRSVAIYMLNNNLTPETIEIVRSDILAEKIKINQVKEDFFLNNENITHRLHSPEVSKLVPFISRFPFIRDFVEGNSIKIANTQNIVIEGRDTTTVVFPNATMKCWVFAEPLVRAQRRWEQNGKVGDLQQILEDVNKRDKMDTEREIAPMKRAIDAFDVDTSIMSIEEVVEKIANEFHSRINK